jgi:hypothetical protein
LSSIPGIAQQQTAVLEGFLKKVRELGNMTVIKIVANCRTFQVYSNSQGLLNLLQRNSCFLYKAHLFVMGDFRKQKGNWTKQSASHTVHSGRRIREPGVQPKIASPWDQQDVDIMENFEQQLAAMEVKTTTPWEERSVDLRAQDAQRAAAQNYKLKSFFDEDEASKRKAEAQAEAAKEYKYHSMFEVPPLTQKQQQIIADYKMNPPFRCSYNQAVEDKRPAKKVALNKNPPTRQPWTYGSVPADPVSKHIFERPPTALWSVPPPDKTNTQNELPSSGDPILDSLRAQLKKHGAAGIAGLSRKFRIMDDDGSGTLNMQEFVKGMKECKLADLTDKALKHLFLYFGT